VATSVNGAFSQFLAELVNLDPNVTGLARASRDWLRGQLHSLPDKYSQFPRSYPEYDVDFGSFARRTKIRDLDDIDLICCIHAEGSTYLDFGGAIYIYVNDGTRLRDMCFDSTNELNSRKVINRFVEYLSAIPQYAKADIGRNGEAAVLDLASYMWSYDIVPGFLTTPEVDGRRYYLIPDGSGRWKKTDPRVDRDRITRINQRHSGNVLNVIRLIKYWNRRPNVPTIPPYVLELSILAHYESAIFAASPYVDVEVGPVLTAIATAVFNPIPDPKGIQGDLNKLSFGDRLEISARATAAAQTANAARSAEGSGDHKTAIQHWGRVFGSSFPSYG
jgi:hypothetical protein